MLKKITAAAAVSILAILPVCAEEVKEPAEGYTTQMTTVIKDGKEDGQLALRFYEETPDIPYIGMNEYSTYVMHRAVTLKENEDGTCYLETGDGGQILYDASKGLITVPDWTGFFNLPLPLEDEALGLKDSTCGYIRITGVDYEGEPQPVELNFSDYGIKSYYDAEDVYLPVSTMSNIMTDIATNHMLYNGEKLYLKRIDLESKAVDDFFNSEMFRAELSGEGRPEDIIKQSYADLCFNFDHFFGHPGVAKLDTAIEEKGLDQALTDLGEEGENIRNGLLSANLGEYLQSMNRLFMVYFGDGHTMFTSGVQLMQEGLSSSENGLSGTLGGLEGAGGLFEDLMDSPVLLRQTLNALIPMQRSASWGMDTYREYGNTAIIRLDTFMPDEALWEAYYKGGGDIPEDCLGTVISGLRKASENPDIHNILFDLSCNGGGSPDVMMAILAVTTGQDQLYGINKYTGQKMTITFETDADFNGVFDEKDKDVHYDFNYGVLNTRHGFSCGNLFPIIAQEGGAVLIGEPTSGGSCCIQMGSDAEGLSYTMSSGQWQLTDQEGVSVESGCSIDLPIEASGNKLLDIMTSAIGLDGGLPQYTDYFNDELLDSMMNDYFEGRAELEDAA